jgi:hypothetical protein
VLSKLFKDEKKLRILFKKQKMFFLIPDGDGDRAADLVSF